MERATNSYRTEIVRRPWRRPSDFRNKFTLLNGHWTGAAIYTGRRLSIFSAEKKVIQCELFESESTLT